MRDVLARRALDAIPVFLSLQDRTPVSPTYGCFDRDYWHTRVADFPSGMYQKLVLPLALVWALDLPDNPYRGESEIRACVEAGIRYASRSAHRDGSTDDYYPYESAAGAAAFSLLACLEASRIIGLVGDPEVDAFLLKRARWLADHEESGRLSNHEALIVNTLAMMAERFGEEWEAPFQRRLARLLSWQSVEGWFDEYGGADPGYLTLTIAQLADLHRRRPLPEVRAALTRAIRFVADVIHPDGTLGGEYASRATPNYFPHGFEMAGAWLPEALAVNDLGLRPLAAGRQPGFSERFAGHHVTGWLLAWQHWQVARPEPLRLPSVRRHYPEAKLLVDVAGPGRLYMGLSRGGALRLYEGETLLLSDTGPTLKLADGRVAVTHIEGETSVAIEDERISVEGRMAFAKTTLLTPLRSIVLRALMLTAGRLAPDLVRRALQRLLVTGRREAPFRFRRIVEHRAGQWQLRDEIVPERGWRSVTAAGIGGFQSSLTTVVSRLWQPMQLQPWIDLTPRLAALGDDTPLIVERRVESSAERLRLAAESVRRTA